MQPGRLAARGVRPGRAPSGPAGARPGCSPPCPASAASPGRCARGRRGRPSQAQTAVVARVPSSRSSSGRSSVSPTKSLFDSDTSTGQPVAIISGSRRVTSSEWQVFLPKSCPGSMSTLPRATPAATARSASPTRALSTSAMTSSYSIAVRPGARRRRRRRACTPARRRGRAATSASCGSQPPQASLSRSAAGLADGLADLVPPGVDADDQSGELGAHRGHERHGALDLLGRVDLVARARP